MEKVTVEDMARAHLGNVHQELKRLGEQRNRLDEQIQELVAYLKAGEEAINDAFTIPKRTELLNL